MNVYCQTPGLVLSLGVDFVLPLSQNKNNKKKNKNPHQNLS